MITRKIEKDQNGIFIVEDGIRQAVPFGQTLYFIKYDDMSVGRVKLTDKFLNNNLEDYEVFLSEEMRDLRFAGIAIDEDAEFKNSMFTGEEIIDAFDKNPMYEKSTEYAIIKNSIINYLKK